MKRIALLPVIAVFVLVFAETSCREKINEFTDSSQVEFTIGLNSLKSVDTSVLSGLSSVIITVENNSGAVVLNSEKVDLYNMNGSYITKPVSLIRGSYKVTRFLVLDWNNNIVYASPLSGSPKAYLVEKPLPVNFDVSKDNVTKVPLEVINSASSSPQQFGYASFDFNVAQTFDFLLGVFIYDETVKNFRLTDANITIYGDSTTIIYSGSIKKISGTSLVSYDSISVTSKITLPERFNKYSLVISKDGYKEYSQTFTKEELKMHFRSIDKGPLVVLLEKSMIDDGLVAYYKFDGNLLDYSGNNNHGTYFGRGLYSNGKNNDNKGAIDLNGSSDYISISNSTALNPQKISICAWYYAISFYGNGSNSLVTKMKTAGSSEYQYHLNVLSDSYNGNPNDPHMRQFGFWITTDQGSFPVTTTGTGNFSYKYFQYNLYQWNFVVGTYDGDSLKLYVNGDLKAWRAATGKFTYTSTDVRIGNSQGFNRSNYDFTGGRIDDVRIYNRALSIDEIKTLYQK